MDNIFYTNGIIKKLKLGDVVNLILNGQYLLQKGVFRVDGILEVVNLILNGQYLLHECINALFETIVRRKPYSKWTISSTYNEAINKEIYLRRKPYSKWTISSTRSLESAKNLIERS